MNDTSQRGLVVLIGAGPGDLSLVTGLAIQWITRADTIIYDRLANPALLQHARKDAQLIYVGKTPGQHTADQDTINRLLVEHGLKGELVVRLKGGDCFIFGRGGEEVDALLEHGIEFRVVPGITAALAAGAYAGIPLTDRRHASSLALVTGQQDPTKAQTTVNWQAVAGIDTVVFYMGMTNLPLIVSQLIAAGKDPATPCAVVQEASTPYQKTVAGPLKEIERIVQESGIHAPALTIVGGVASMFPRMAWFERLPLYGKTILVTRPADQAGELAGPLAELGAAIIECPAVEIRPPADQAAMDAALRNLGQYDLVAFTSVNGVKAFIERCRKLRIDARALAKAKVAAVGPATAEALEAAFLHPDIHPDQFTTQALADAILAAGDWAGKRVLLGRADIASQVLPDTLKKAGAHVDEVDFYQSVRPAALNEDALAALQGRHVDWLTFASSSSVTNFLELMKVTALSTDLLDKTRLAVIGPVTAKTLEERLRPADAVADPHTVQGLVRAILQANKA